MSIEVKQLSKTFGVQTAVDAVSFTIEPGETCGFLGPNGAGKSTTLKMITGYLQPTAGGVLVNSVNVAEQPLEAKKNIGYLPEHNPLYMDMYVREFLSFVAKVHNLGSGRKAAIDRVIEQTGLGKESHKHISSLSKGYRQRVGLAQALIHDPQVVILDEPLSGLDPNQLGELREVIRDLGKTKTVIFSSHILQEVEQVSDRILVINNGKLVADSPANQLKNKLSANNVVTFEFAEVLSDTQFQALGELGQLQKLSESSFELSGDDHQLTLITLKEQEQELTDIFKTLTQA